MEDVRVPEPAQVPAESSTKLTGSAWLAAFRKEQALRIARMRAEQKAKARTMREHRNVSAGAENVFTPKTELSPEEIERRRQRKNARQRRYLAKLRKANLQTPEAKAKRKAANQKRWRRNRKKRERHERWTKRRAAAAAKREAKAQRRARRERIASEKAAVLAVQGLTKRPTPTERKVQEAYASGFRDGYQEGLRVAQDQ